VTLLPCSRVCSRGAGTWQATEGEGVRWIGNACSSSAKTIDIEGGRRAGGRLSPSLCISLYLSGTKKGKEAVTSINTGAKPRSKTLEQTWNKIRTAELRSRLQAEGKACDRKSDVPIPVPTLRLTELPRDASDMPISTLRGAS
jgi:hypothetical protein